MLKCRHYAKPRTVVRNQTMTRRLTITLITFFTLLVVEPSLGQDTSKLNTTWQTLKTQLLRRTILSNHLLKILKQSEIADTRLVEKLKTNTVLLRDLLGLNRLDSIAITEIHDRNDSLSISISKSFDVLQNDKSVGQTTELGDVAMQLEGTENRIYVAIRDFNEICKSSRRENLYFKKPFGDTEAVEIKFDSKE